jgi:prevent-host-death family protein
MTVTTYLSITQVKRYWYEVMDRVAAGEDIVVTKWGRATVRFVRIDDSDVNAGASVTQ